MTLPSENNVVEPNALEVKPLGVEPLGVEPLGVKPVEVKPSQVKALDVKAGGSSALPSLLEQRLALRRQLADQREIIAFRLTPGSQLRLNASAQGMSYPRSLTMRLLTKNPAPVIKLAIGVATWLIGKRLSGALHEGMRFIKMLRTEARPH